VLLFKSWIEALRSDKYKQIYGEMENENGVCAGGILPKLNKGISCGMINLWDSGLHFSKDFLLNEKESKIKFDKFRNMSREIATWNDKDKLTFPEIAHRIEAALLSGAIEEIELLDEPKEI